MQLTLSPGDIAHVRTEGIVVQVDGAICVLGSASSRAVKHSIPLADRGELWGYVEDSVRNLRPLKDGEARVVDGEGAWAKLVVVSAVPHQTEHHHYTPAEYAAVLQLATRNGVRAAAAAGLRSIAMTSMASTYRLTGEAAVEAMSRALAECRREPVAVTWCFIDQAQLAHARLMGRRLGLV